MHIRSPNVSSEETSENVFNTLKWWHDHKLTYTVIYILARDVFTVHVSTTSSEYAYSLGGRIIEEKRACLTPHMVNTLMTVKVGKLAEQRNEHTSMDLELIAT